ncbi:hypothetical protein GCM10027089_56850 [Nocardia thraciensis]
MLWIEVPLPPTVEVTGCPEVPGARTTRVCREVIVGAALALTAERGLDCWSMRDHPGCGHTVHEDCPAEATHRRKPPSPGDMAPAAAYSAGV